MKSLYCAAYSTLRRVAARCLKRERRNHTLQATALVNEAYLRLATYDRVDWKGQAHVVRAAARIMRQILVNHAQARNTTKRGGGRTIGSIEEAVIAFSDRGLELLELDDALRALSRTSERLVRVVELRFFAGLTIHEVAATLGVSVSTVERDWTMARAWLHRQLASGA